MEGLRYLKYLLEKNDFLHNAMYILKMPIAQYHCAQDQERLWDSFGQKIFTNISSLFWISRNCSQDFFETFEGINSSVETVNHSSSDTLQRYSSDMKNILMGRV